ncbi:ankyrin repeat domain-containing protein [Methylomonas sp. 2BW1-5-20]|uniref:ankyrin repeat domain-containing protein n=1 Tax=Methylomonas sp. 2BW1-5-20 TaxID=3376686 RepID=UPI004052ED7D
MSITPEINNWLAENGFTARQPSAKNPHGKHALILAAQQGRADVLAFLLRQDADIAVLDAYGNNALWAACFAEAGSCIELLLQAGIAVDYQNPSGATALTYAASSGKQAVVKQLLEAGADPLLTTQDDFSALDLAANRQCLQLLRDAVKALQA